MRFRMDLVDHHGAFIWIASHRSAFIPSHGRVVPFFRTILKITKGLFMDFAFEKNGHHCIGSRVIADWKGLGLWFLGEVLEIGPQGFLIGFIDQDREWVPPVRVRKPELVVGLRVLARYKGGAIWFPGVVVSFDGQEVAIQYLDGDQELTTPNLVRMEDIKVGDLVVVDLSSIRQYVLGHVLFRYQDYLSIELKDRTTHLVTVKQVGVDLEARQA